MHKIVVTADGSNTLFNEVVGEHYHSINGAVSESSHVFVDGGLKHAITQSGSKEIFILEIGFGTGLNFLLSLGYSVCNNIMLNYTGLEPFPLTIDEIKSTGYGAYVTQKMWCEFLDSYPSVFDKPEHIAGDNVLRLFRKSIQEFQTDQKFHVIYFDAFSANRQPEMWLPEIIAHASNFLIPEGAFVTYSITGKLKQTFKSLGFRVERLPGAPGKKEMLRAVRI